MKMVFGYFKMSCIILSFFYCNWHQRLFAGAPENLVTETEIDSINSSDVEVYDAEENNGAEEGAFSDSITSSSPKLMPQSLLLDLFVDTPAQYQGLPYNQINLDLSGGLGSNLDSTDDYNIESDMYLTGATFFSHLNAKFLPGTFTLSATSFNVRAIAKSVFYVIGGDGIRTGREFNSSLKSRNYSITPSFSFSLSDSLFIGLSYNVHYTDIAMNTDGKLQNYHGFSRQFDTGVLYKAQQFEVGVGFKNAVHQNQDTETTLDDAEEPATTTIHGRLQLAPNVAGYGHISYLNWRGVDTDQTLKNQLIVKPGAQIIFDEKTEIILQLTKAFSYYRKKEYRDTANVGTLTYFMGYTYKYTDNIYTGASAQFLGDDEDYFHHSDSNDKFNYLAASLMLRGGVYF